MRVYCHFCETGQVNTYLVCSGERDCSALIIDPADLDNELIDIEHLCCLAHARAKFKYAYEQGCKSAYFFLYMIGRLYRLEEEYRRLKLSPQEIYERRNDDTTTEIVESIRTRLYELLADGNFTAFAAGALLVWEIPDSPGSVGAFLQAEKLARRQIRKFGGTDFLLGEIAP